MDLYIGGFIELPVVSTENKDSVCDSYGIIGGCDVNCPVLRASLCELQDSDNAGIYQDFLGELS